MIWSSRYGGLFLVVVVALIQLSRAAYSQGVDLPKGAGPLPDTNKGAKSGALVTAEHIHLYRMLLPPEVAELVEQGEFAFEAVRAPKEAWKQDTSNPSEQVVLSSSGELKQMPTLPLENKMFTPGAVISGDPKHFAFQVLWNAAASLWRYHSLSVGVSSYLFTNSHTAPHKLEFLIDRIHPHALGAPPSTLQPVFREKVSAKKPGVIDGLAWLTLRYLGPAEDFVWIASPVVKAIRQVTGSNRSDQIFTGAFSADDLFVWSGKVELSEPVSISFLPLLVPFIEKKGEQTPKVEGCASTRFMAGASLLLQCQSPRFRNVGGWVPTNAAMILRGAYRIELSARDPFSVDSRQVLYVDSESGLPIYRIVWDQAGRRQRVSIGLLRLLELDSTPSAPVHAGQVIVYSQDGRRLVLGYENWSACDRYVPGRALEDFDPTTFVRFGKETAKPPILAETITQD